MEAAVAMCGAEFPRTDLDGQGALRVQTCSVIDEANLEIIVYTPSLAASAATVVPVSFISCDPYAHHQQMGAIFGAGLVGIAMILVVHIIFRPLRQNQ